MAIHIWPQRVEANSKNTKTNADPAGCKSRAFGNECTRGSDTVVPSTLEHCRLELCSLMVVRRSFPSRATRDQITKCEFENVISNRPQQHLPQSRYAKDSLHAKHNRQKKPNDISTGHRIVSRLLPLPSGSTSSSRPLIPGNPR